MALIYITGISGSGKSAVRAELLKRGHEAYGTDEDGIAAFYNNVTGKMVGNPLGTPPRSQAWNKAHTWKISKETVQRLAAESGATPVFLCGTTSDDVEIWHVFAKVFALTIDEATLRHRLATRTTNTFGKSAHELKGILEWQQTAADDYIKLGATLIDATQPIETVVDEILDRL